MAIKQISNDRINRNAKDDRCWHDGWKAVNEWNETYGSDQLVVYENTENITYAVYHKHFHGGELICKLSLAGKALPLDLANEFDKKVLELHRQEALADGFPPYHPATVGTIETGEMNGWCGREAAVERWDKRTNPFISVQCGYGRLYATIGGDQGIYDDIQVELMAPCDRLLLRVAGVRRGHQA